MQKKASILLIKAHLITRIFYQIYFQILGIKVDIAKNGAAALKYYQDSQYHYIVIDLFLNDTDGITLAEWFRILEKNDMRSKAYIALITQDRKYTIINASSSVFVDNIYTYFLQFFMLKNHINKALH